MPQLVIITGPIAAGKNTVADRLTERLTGYGRTVVLADVDEVAAMVGAPGAGRAGLWFAAHEAHGALVGQWLRSNVDYVVAVGPFWTAEERDALTRTLPDGVDTLWVVVDAPVSVTLRRAQADPTRGLSRDAGFHRRAHDRFRGLMPTIPVDRTFDSGEMGAEQIAAAIAEALGVGAGDVRYAAGKRFPTGPDRDDVSAAPERIDVPFTAQVRTALETRIGSIVDEAAGDTWRDLPHRALAERIKALVAATRAPFGLAGGADLLGHAAGLASRLRELQGGSGLFTGGDNVDSPPDSAFSVNDLADALLMLRHADSPPDGELALADQLERLLAAATPALTSGGVHTPNHRWELSAALARLHRLAPQPALVERIDQWLAEGVDIDDDGLYSERSANYAAFVSNPSLLTIAAAVDRPGLVDAVERNLDATLDLLLPDGSVETVMSRRQDQHRPMPLAPYLLPLRQLASLRGRGDLAWAAGVALAQGIVSPAEAATRLVLDPAIAEPLPAPVPPERPRQRVFGSAGLLVDHRDAATTVLFGGSDYARHRRIRSGLANSPTFLRLFAGAAVLESARLSRTFFGLGPFRGDGLVVEPDTAPATTVTLRETVSAGYYQPLVPRHRDAHGRYRLVDEGRFSAEMDFDRRTRDDVTLTTTVQARLTAGGVELTVRMTGPVVDWALELAFRPGGTMTGARAVGDQAWQLDVSPGAAARYEIAGDAIAVALVDASDGDGNPLAATTSMPAYEPGEEYRFLGGTDAVSGSLLYVVGRVPAQVRMIIGVDGR